MNTRVKNIGAIIAVMTLAFIAGLYTQAFAMTTDHEKPAATSKAPEMRVAPGGTCPNGCLREDEDFDFG